MNDIPIELCKVKSYHKTLKILKKEHNQNKLDKFIKFLTRKRKYENKLSFDVSTMKKLFFKYFFQININEEDTKLRLTSKSENVKAKRKKIENKTDLIKKKKIPKEFINHILTLGFSEIDASRLYEEKDNWIGVNSGAKVLCTYPGCKFHTDVASDALFDHCQVKHKWKDYPCPNPNCKFIAYSSTTLKKNMLPFIPNDPIHIMRKSLIFISLSSDEKRPLQFLNGNHKKK